MSKTYRRKKGHRWFAEKQIERIHTRVLLKETYICPFSGKEKNRVNYVVTYNNLGYDADLISKYERDGAIPGLSHRYKWYVNKSDRACRRHQLHKICRGEQDYYDDSFENTRQRDYLWVVW
jgi:hypothetical protein